MTPARQSSGRAARRAGEQFEQDVRNAHRPPGVYLRRTCPATKMIKVAGKNILVPEDGEQGCPDFHGTYKGTSIIFECKSTSATRWPLKMLDPKQATAFDEAAAAGAVTGILLRFDKTAAIYWLPWAAVRSWWQQQQAGTGARGDSSLLPEDCASLGVRVVGYYWWTAATK